MWCRRDQEEARRARSRSFVVVATTDPATLPDLTTFYLFTNLASPDGERDAGDRELRAADLAEVTRLYALRSWIEQSYKQVKNALGWAHYQVRKDLSIRRHWQLVCCAFSFCWWACTDRGEMSPPPVVVLEDFEHPSAATVGTVGGKKRTDTQPPPLSWPRALRKVRSWLTPYVMLWRYWRAFSGMPPPQELRVLLERLFAGRGFRLYAH